MQCAFLVFKWKELKGNFYKYGLNSAFVITSNVAVITKVINSELRIQIADFMMPLQISYLFGDAIVAIREATA